MWFLLIVLTVEPCDWPCDQIWLPRDMTSSKVTMTKPPQIPVKQQASKLEVVLVSKVEQLFHRDWNPKQYLGSNKLIVNETLRLDNFRAITWANCYFTSHRTSFLIMWHQMLFQVRVTLIWLGLNLLRKGFLENAILWVCLTKAKKMCMARGLKFPCIWIDFSFWLF